MALYDSSVGGQLQGFMPCHWRYKAASAQSHKLESKMPCVRIRYLLMTHIMVMMHLFGTQAVYANARNLPAAPLQTPEYSTPPIEIQVPPRPPESLKNRSQAPGAAPLAPVISSKASAPNLGAAACPPDQLGSPISNSPAIANQFERLRATASGTVSPENRQLLTGRQQRLQATAAWQMGLLTLHGICVVLNTADAEAWFARAYQLGEPLAAAGLAWCEIEGCKAAANPAAAKKWIELLRRIDAPRALYLQWLMQSRLAPMEIKPSSPGSAEKGYTALQYRQLLLSAAQRGDTNAKIELGLDSVFSNELAEALTFFKGASSKSTAAAINTVVMNERLHNAAKLQPTTRSSSSINIKQQSAAENLAQAQRYHRGIGVPSNYTEAIRLYQLAQNQGSETAKKMLELIFSRPGPDGQIDLAWMQQLAQVDLRSALPSFEKNNAKQNLRREPTPLFELVPQQWKKYATASVSA